KTQELVSVGPPGPCCLPGLNGNRSPVGAISAIGLVEDDELKLLKGDPTACAGNVNGDQTAIPKGHGYSPVAWVKELEDGDRAVSFRHGPQVVNRPHRDPWHPNLQGEIGAA